MAVTYKTAADRDAGRRAQVAAGRAVLAEPLELFLAGVSIFAGILLLLTYVGVARVPHIESPDAGVVNLNASPTSERLAAVLDHAFPLAADRRIAQQQLMSFLTNPDGSRWLLPNVGAIARARVPSAVIDRSPSAAVYRERLAQERERARSSGREAPSSVPLLTSAQLSSIKPWLVVRNFSTVRRSLAMWTALYLAAFYVVSIAWRGRRLRGDRVLLIAAHVLTALGLAAMISRPDPLRDLLLFPRYVEGILAGLAVLTALSFVNVRTSSLKGLSYLPLAAAFALSLLLLSPLGSGPAGSGAKVNLGPFQPIEAIRILLALFLAGYFSRHWELLRAVRSSQVGNLMVPSWLNLPRARYAIPVLVGVGAALALFFGQRDLGPALMLAVVFLIVYAVARGTIGMALAGSVLLAAGFYLGYQLGISATLADRVRMWRAPWDNVARGGDQIAQALWAMATGAQFGAGPGLGDARYLPAGHTDLILASVSEELGFAGLVAVALVYAALVARAVNTARKASTDYGFFLAITLALFLVVPVLLMMSGTLGIVPLTGVVTPFLSFGGSAMVANFAALGLLSAIRSDAAPRADLSSFRVPVQWLRGGLAMAAVLLVAIAGLTVVRHADELIARPHLGLQADGMRRFQYNPRLLDVVRQIPRGSIVDRNDLVMATDDLDVARKAAPAYAKAGVSLDSSCAVQDARCYPLGGRAFHLLGDARTRRNWGASNTSFVERDAESALRGFDDHQAMVTVRDADGIETAALRRDYRDLVPVFRHRFDPEYPAVKALMNPHRELRLTIDARLQARVAAIVSSYARRSSSGRAAAVVVDPATGDLLASVSYPWPVDAMRDEVPGADEGDNDALLDRARYGLYPPGSTFKLLTAAAALRRDASASGQTFTCSRLSDNRVGVKMPGFTRPVRDDVLDTHPHGTIDMHRALVVSCNAYFAQLAVKLGPQALLAVAQPAEISLARNNAVSRIRGMLPQVGYGQGEVVASPLRMAAIAAAIAADGNIREVRVRATDAQPAQHPFLPPEIAKTLGSYMRDVVVDGTGRSVKTVPVPIAGKTGTAEVSGAPSHSWFVGFAPYGAATHRVAVAVILENAGYGGQGAAPAAGEIIAAAAVLGLAK
jgi:cell division protein FtsW (lipid II flippase)